MVLSRDLAEIAAGNFSYAPYETPLSWENRAGFSDATKKETPPLE